MSDFDRSATPRFGAGVGRAGYAQIDQGLRTYMLGVYNHMVLGLALTGLTALGTNMLAVTHTGAGRPLDADRPGAVLQPAEMGGDAGPAGVHLPVLVPDRPHVGQFGTRHLPGLLGRDGRVDVVDLPGLYRSAIGQVFFITAASFGGLSLFGYTTAVTSRGWARSW